MKGMVEVLLKIMVLLVQKMQQVQENVFPYLDTFAFSYIFCTFFW